MCCETGVPGTRIIGTAEEDYVYKRQVAHWCFNDPYVQVEANPIRVIISTTLAGGKRGLGADNHSSAVFISRSKRRAGEMGKNPQFGRSVRRSDCERLACQCDRPRLTAVHVAPALRCPPASPSTVARAPRRQLSTRHTTGSACQGIAEVWILLVERDGGRCPITRKGWLVGRKRAR